jgi:hypothetical protein
MSSSAVSAATKPDSTVKAAVRKSVTPLQTGTLVMPPPVGIAARHPAGKTFWQIPSPCVRLACRRLAANSGADFDNADIRDILRGRGMQYGVKHFIEPGVTGTIYSI